VLFLDQYPELIVPDLGREPVHALAAHCGAVAVAQPEPPVMERANNLGVFHPTSPKRSTRVRAAIQEGHDLPAYLKNCQTESLDFVNRTLVWPTLSYGTQIDPFWHDVLDSLAVRTGKRTT
jgi:hypothetical protein